MASSLITVTLAKDAPMSKQLESMGILFWDWVQYATLLFVDLSCYYIMYYHINHGEGV
jgi:hypothetical protein